MSWLFRLAPGLGALRHYRRQDWRHDLVAGLSVAAVALPVGIAYADLAGFSPAVGLYSSILPLLAYALFGSSRQLIVGPDAATCALVAASVSSLAVQGTQEYLAISVTLAFMAGLMCIGASFLRLGVLADFLSHPILTGFMNGMAISIALGQLGKLFGFPMTSTGIIPRLLEFAHKIGQTHWQTLAVAMSAFAVLGLLRRLLPKWPAGLVVMVVAALAVAMLQLHHHGVAIIGAVPSGLPHLFLPTFSPGLLKPLLADAAAIALIAFTSMIPTARSFAVKNGYGLDTDRDLAALGAANIASALSQGFAISGADSRTAVNDAAGGRTQLAGVVAAASIAVVVLFLTSPLQFVPIAALGAVLMMAAASLFDYRMLKQLWREDKAELTICLIVMFGVVVVGAIGAILVAVVLALLRFLRLVARPECEVLGQVPDVPGFHSLARHPNARPVTGFCLFRFNSPIVFFNAEYFKHMALQSVEAAGAEVRWFVIDAIPVTSCDVTGRHCIKQLKLELSARGIELVVAGRQTELTDGIRRRGLLEMEGLFLQFPTLQSTIERLRRA